MKLLVVGAGGREHALCWALSGSPLCDTLYCAPGNAGIAEVAECVDVGAEDVEGLMAFVGEKEIDFVVVGPEAPLVLGLVDRLNEAGVKCFGPTAAAAELEGSKSFTKALCVKYDIPTGAYQRFTEIEGAKSYIREQGAPIVVKADGLAAGKGVTVAMSVEEALAAAEDALVGGRFGDAGASIVVEEFLDGEELSVFALSDGENALMLASAQDHKAVGDGDTGPNTGGMGAYSPAPVMTDELANRIEEEIVGRTVAAMKAEGTPFTGVLFGGLMITKEGPKLIEFNVRFGDPECQVLMMRLKSDLLSALVAAADGELKDFGLRWLDETALTVVLAANGYPESYEKGTEIRNLDAADGLDLVKVFHAGTARGANGELQAIGGRVLNVTALGDSATDAQRRAYEAVDAVDWPDGFCRRDIGWRAVARETD
ncbi:MAG TPA: phosphoribosylamine--glycine ligase [Rhodospirillaceae bacterium]|nr:phosphoribosylamine--glycine ligase [Rhodospirillaceae bacterium]HAA92700.1 phosphoribosylamine--glycine ligase [Rhodospirillaceae bacterium]HAT36116.1 phosphoribosylamine--glycine ligase [Rhodospirillaceae bacterium]